jgi:hypothetical protein
MLYFVEHFSKKKKKSFFLFFLWKDYDKNFVKGKETSCKALPRECQSHFAWPLTSVRTSLILDGLLDCGTLAGDRRSVSTAKINTVGTSSRASCRNKIKQK